VVSTGSSSHVRFMDVSSTRLPPPSREHRPIYRVNACPAWHFGCAHHGHTMTCHQIPKNAQAFTEFERQVLSDAMARLSVEHRAVIRRAYYRGWSTQQIAEDLKLSECEVKCRLHYGFADCSYW
jgi:DNA-directed RNA polymerase specialized sigma24 family protein